MQPTAYKPAQIGLHWIVAALIVLQYVFHEPIAEAWDVIEDGGTAAFDPMVAGHVFGGLAVLGLVVWRLVLRARHGAPEVPAQTPPLMARFASLGHWALYGLMIAMPVSGAAAWFGGIEAAADGHELLRVVLLALVAGHVLAALWHQFFLKDNLMARMRRSR